MIGQAGGEVIKSMQALSKGNEYLPVDGDGLAIFAITERGVLNGG